MFGIEYVPDICQWIGEDESRCDENVVKGKSYCEHHQNICYLTLGSVEEVFSITDNEVEQIFNNEEIDAD